MVNVRTLSDLRFAQAVLEVRYPKAHKYWDDCGKAIETIEQRLPGLKCEALTDQGFRFSGAPERGLSTAQFFWDKTTSTIVEVGAPAFPKKFAEGAAEFWRLVAQQLGVQNTTFVGNRFWYYVPFSSQGDGEDWLAQQQLWQFIGGDARLGSVLNEGLRLRTNIEDRTVAVRLGTGQISAPAQKAAVGVILDVDFKLLQSPPVSRLDAGAVVQRNIRLLEQFVAAFFNQA